MDKIVTEQNGILASFSCLETNEFELCKGGYIWFGDRDSGGWRGVDSGDPSQFIYNFFFLTK